MSGIEMRSGASARRQQGPTPPAPHRKSGEERPVRPPDRLTTPARRGAGAAFRRRARYGGAAAPTRALTRWLAAGARSPSRRCAK
jgi:hypothetical protein